MEKTVRVLIIAPRLLPIPAVGGGAIETLITNLLDENEKRRRFRFVVISVPDDRAEAITYKYSKVCYCKDGVIEYGFKPFSHLYYKAITLMHRIKNKASRIMFGQVRQKPDELPFDPFFIQCRRIAKKEKVKYIIEEDWSPKQFPRFYDIVGKENIYFHLHGNLKEDLAFRQIINNSISVSEFIRRDWVVDQTIPGRNIVIHNGIDTKRFGKVLPPEERTRQRKALGISDNEMLAIFCGRLIPEKGVKELLEAFELLQDYPVRLLLIGSVNFSKDDSTNYSEEMILKAKNMKSVTYLGYVPNEKLHEYTQLADMQIIPSIWQDPAPLACIEGMASGLPQIITKSGGMVEYASEDCAIILPIDDHLSENIAQAVIRLLHDPNLRKKMGKAGRERAGQFSIACYYDSFVAEFCRNQNDN